MKKKYTKEVFLENAEKAATCCILNFLTREDIPCGIDFEMTGKVQLDVFENIN